MSTVLQAHLGVETTPLGLCASGHSGAETGKDSVQGGSGQSIAGKGVEDQCGAERGSVTMVNKCGLRLAAQETRHR